MDATHESYVEADVLQEKYPWAKDDTPKVPDDSPNPQQTFTTPDDLESPLRSLAMLTSFLTSRKCASSQVPSDLRDVVRQEVRVTTIALNDALLQRLKELDAISDAFMKERAQKKLDIPSPTEKEELDRFLDYILRRGMTALLNLLKALHEDGKTAVVQTVLDRIKSRKYLEDEKPTTRSVVDHGGYLPESAVSVVSVNVQQGRLHEGKRIYKMQSRPKGHVLLINIENFDQMSTNLTLRVGTHVDGDRLAKLFTELGFVLYRDKQHWNLTKKEMSDLVEEFSRFDGHREADASVVVILSHGHDKGRIFGSDGEPVFEHEIREFFTAPNCEALAGKPKLFLFVACRGGNNDNGHLIPVNHGRERGDLRGSGDSTVEADAAPFTPSAVKDFSSSAKIPSHVDFFVVYAAAPGHVNIRDVLRGTWFVDDFVKVVAEEAHINDLAAMVCEVNNRMSERATPELGKQSLHVMTTLRKNLFLNPGF